MSFLGKESFFEVYSTKDGNILAQSPSLRRNQNLLGKSSWQDIKRQDEDKGWDIRLNNMPLRCFAIKIQILKARGSGSSSSKKAFLIVAMERNQANRRWEEIMIRSGIGLILLFISSSLGVWYVVGRATEPLKMLIQDVSRITPKEIQPVRIPHDPELALLAGRVNESLQSVSQYVEREKRFSADVSHELLTPLGGLRAVVEVALLHPRPESELESALKQCGTITSQMQTLVENLLGLSRLESRSIAESHESLNLMEIVDVIWADFASAASERGISLENQIPPDTWVSAPPGLLSIILNNLLSNILRYARPNSQAWAKCKTDGADVELAIYNESDNLPVDFALHGFDRFWRGDPSRSRKSMSSHEGTGLGLSLARAAASAMNQELTVEVLEERIVRMSISIQSLKNLEIIS